MFMFMSCLESSMTLHSAVQSVCIVLFWRANYEEIYHYNLFMLVKIPSKKLTH